MLDREGYRPNVGIILVNARNEVFWGKRIREHSWQFPQGGIKYGESPYTIRIRPDSARPDHVAIDVVDRGAGVPEEFRDQLFKEFSRATGTVATGTGLGLHVVRTLAEAQNGRVTYRPGQYGGSVFTISLMAVTEPPLSEPPVEGAGGPTDRS